MEVQPIRSSTSFWRRMGTVGQNLLESKIYAVLGNRSVTADVLLTTMSVVEQTLNAIPLTTVNSDVNKLEALTPITSYLATRMSACHVYHTKKNLLIIENYYGTYSLLKSKIQT